MLENLLQKDPDFRNMLVVEKIMKLTKEVRFFKEISEKYGDKIHLRCCKFMKKEFFSKGMTLFNQGDVGNHFYIILKGTVGLKCKIYHDNSGDFIEKDIGEMTTGTAFGELAILENKPRAATVVCKTDCMFASLNKGDYRNILGFYYYSAFYCMM